MSSIDKTYWRETKVYKLFGKPFYEIEVVTNGYKGDGEFINSTCPNERYFEQEFKRKEDI